MFLTPATLIARKGNLFFILRFCSMVLKFTKVMFSMERLHKFMARAGVASRRQSEDLIARGLVKVNGKVVTTPGLKIDPARDRVEVNGKILYKPERKVYILLNKPAGYVTTVSDPRGRRKVTDLLPGISQRVYPVGRLDYNTEGLLLLTNDGDLAYYLTHPSHQVPKTYIARVTGVPSTEKLEALARGIELDDGPTAPAKVRLIKNIDNQHSILKITIHEGKNRQVRRMCEHIGHPVEYLRRVSMGPLQLGRIKPGQYRHLTQREVKRLKKIVGIKQGEAYRQDIPTER